VVTHARAEPETPSRPSSDTKPGGRHWGTVVAAGVAVSVLGLCNLETLSRSRESFCVRARFADVFLSVKRAPLSAARRLAELPGIAAVEPRVVAQVLRRSRECGTLPTSRGIFRNTYRAFTSYTRQIRRW
jgi:hypothetical protein